MAHEQTSRLGFDGNAKCPHCGAVIRQKDSCDLDDLRRKQFEAIIDVVAEHAKLSPKHLLWPARGLVSWAYWRHVAIYIANVEFIMNQEAVGDLFGRDRSTISFSVRKVEDLRESPEIDALIDRLAEKARARLGQPRDDGGR